MWCAVGIVMTCRCRLDMRVLLLLLLVTGTDVNIILSALLKLLNMCVDGIAYQNGI